MKLALIAGCALAALPAAAQSAAAPRAKAAPAKPPPLTVAASVNAKPAPVQAGPAGRLVIVADGIVANTAAPQAASPSAGFVYEL